MRVVLAPDRFAALTSVEAAHALSTGWRQRAPQVTCDLAPQTDGGPGFLAAVGAAVGGSLEMLTVDADGIEHPVPVLYVDGDRRVAYVEAAAAIPAAAADSSALGTVLAQLLEDQPAQVIIGIGGVRTLDGGRGLIRALGGRGAEAPVTARDRLAGTTVTAAVDTDGVLLGLQGVCAGAVESHGQDQAVAQAAEREMGEWVDTLRRAIPPARDLLTGKPRRVDRLPGAGAGGGLGFALAALGATLRSGPALSAELTALGERMRAATMAVTATTSYDWRVLVHSVGEEVAKAAAAVATPAVLLADDVQVGRRETMSLGFAASYGVLPAGALRAPGESLSAGDSAAALTALASRVAGTWTPTRR